MRKTKKIISIVTAVMMFMQLFAAVSLANDSILPYDLGWSSSGSGHLQFTVPESVTEDQQYGINLYKNGTSLGQVTVLLVDEYELADSHVITHGCLTEDIFENGSGVYTYTLSPLDSSYNELGTTEFSTEFTYAVPSASLPKPTDVALTANTLSWTPVNNTYCEGYEVSYYAAYPNGETFFVFSRDINGAASSGHTYTENNDVLTYYSQQVDRMYSLNATKYPKEQAYLAACVEALSNDILVCNPSGKTDCVAVAAEDNYFRFTLASMNGEKGKTAKTDNIYNSAPESMRFGLLYASSSYEENIPTDAKLTFKNSSCEKSYTAESTPLKYIADGNFILEVAVPEDLPLGVYTLTIELDIASEKGTEDVKPYIITVTEFEVTSVDRSSISAAYYDAAKVLYDLSIMPEIYEKATENAVASDFYDILEAITGDVIAPTASNGLITYVNVIEQLVTATGYEVTAEANGGYPMGYLAAGSSVGITDGVSLSSESTLTYEQLAQLVYNTLETPVMEQTSFGENPTYEVTKDTLLYRLGYDKYIGSTVISGGNITVNGTVYTRNYPEGTAAENKVLAILDEDIKSYTDDGMMLYVKDNSVISGLKCIEANSKNLHKVTYKVNGEIFEEAEVECGQAIPPLEQNPTAEGKSFVGWEPELPEEMPDEDITVNAVFVGMALESLDNLLSAEEKEQGYAVTATVNTAPESTAIEAEIINKYSQYTAAITLDITISKAKENESATAITETEGLVTFVIDIPKELRGKSEYIILREHNGTVDAITTSANADGEYIEVSGDTITLHASKFSIYTLAAKAKTVYSGGGSLGSSKYTVKFETNGAEEIPAQSVAKNAKATKPADPVKEGYIFEGWYSDYELTSEYDFASPVTKAVTLFAKWTEDSQKTEESNTPAEETAVPEFTDINSGEWYYSAVTEAVEKGLMRGVSENEFAPDKSLTRGMFVTILHRAAGEPDTSDGAPFADVDTDAYYEKAVKWASENGIVNGITENTFAPDMNITREQMAAVIHRFIEYSGIEVNEGDAPDYTDSDSISAYAKEAVKQISRAGILQGNADGSFAPARNTTRAEAAVLFARLLELMK